MTETYVLDTNVVLLLARGGPQGQAIAQGFGLLVGGVRPLISVVTHGEMWVLAERNDWGEKKRTFLRQLLDNLVTVEISQPVIDAYVAIDLASHKHADGARNMSKNDLWIAATASAARAVLLTTDKDFAHLEPALLRHHYVDQRIP